ncbi:hypothetical protein COCHEDRAFT_1045051, partial [Bipolaris maydis C5]
QFQQYATNIEWDDNALMRMYRQGLKPMVRRELMRSGANVTNLDELIAEAIRLDNELYELALEERLFNQGTRNYDNRNDRPRQQHHRRSQPNQGRQRSYQPRTPGAYATNGYEPMHLDNINQGKGPSKPHYKKDKDDKKKINCYASEPVSDEEYETPDEEEQSLASKYEKMARFQEENRPSTP